MSEKEEKESVLGEELEEMHKELGRKLATILDELNDREERVIRLRYGLDDGISRSYEEIAKEFNLTRERNRQIEVKAIKKARRFYKEKESSK